MLQYCFGLYFQFFGHEACGILASQPEMESELPALEGEVLTTGLLGKFPGQLSLQNNSTLWKGLEIRVIKHFSSTYIMRKK